MKNLRDNSEPSLSFSGAAALLLLVAAFCVYPVGEQLWACILAALAFCFLSLGGPRPTQARVEAEARRRRRDVEDDG
jgi:hypothetical protein